MDVFESIPDGDHRFTRFEGTDPHPSAWCPDCQAPPFRPHDEGCDSLK